MLSELLLLLVFGVLGYGAYRLWSNRQQNGNRASPLSTSTPSNATIEQVRPGGMIQLPPHGEDMEERDVQITARHAYRQDGFNWYELEGQSGAGTVWLDVEHDDELETSVTLQRLALDDIGLTTDALAGLKQGATVNWQDKAFRFAEKGRAQFLKNGDAQSAEALEFWDFEGDDERHDLGIERWDQDYRVYVTQRIDPARIRIYSLGDNT
ncbi:DUF4178 domain-containing protein [Marinobacter fonticola]|uniref:DUF4178 domain-containing protein n=1 Tax=Marinobacter fonticola TaxID=2603215 RepID=UPI00143DE60B|nr:DUF4178 domain-containing protein [Marinobacter fonticola]